MLEYSKDDVRQKTNYTILFRFFFMGIRKLFSSGKQAFLFSVVCVLLLVPYAIKFHIIGFSGPLANTFYHIYNAAFWLVFAIILLAMITLIGMPKEYLRMKHSFTRIGLMNSAEESPYLLSIRANDNRDEWLFDAAGIPLETWQDKQTAIETALNVHIISIETGNNNQQVRLLVLPGNLQLQSSIAWSWNKMPISDYELILGEGHTGTVIVNLNASPHMMIGGATGSGKTVLIRSLLAQCMAKGAQVIIADFKKVDFSKIWRNHCQVITEEDDFIEALNSVVQEMHRRQKLFQETDSANIGDYNQNNYDCLERIVIGCDEVSELLDSTGASKERKQKIAEIENALSTIARQGRAFGISLILGTQRPSADIISGQIKNNITYKVCGRADRVLSGIILDNSDAATMIPGTSQGRFLDSNGVLFQTYYFKDENLKELFEKHRERYTGGLDI